MALNAIFNSWTRFAMSVTVCKKELGWRGFKPLTSHSLQQVYLTIMPLAHSYSIDWLPTSYLAKGSLKVAIGAFLSHATEIYEARGPYHYHRHPLPSLSASLVHISRQCRKIPREVRRNTGNGINKVSQTTWVTLQLLSWHAIRVRVGLKAAQRKGHPLSSDQFDLL